MIEYFSLHDEARLTPLRLLARRREPAQRHIAVAQERSGNPTAKVEIGLEWRLKGRHCSG